MHMCAQSEQSNFHIDAGLICGHQTSTTIRPGIIYCNDVLEDLPPEERQDNHPSCQALYSRRGDTFVPAVSNSISILLVCLTATLFAFTVPNYCTYSIYM